MTLLDKLLVLPNIVTRAPALSTRALLIYVVFGLIFALNFFGFTDPDYWWHLRTGQYIVETNSIPKVDLFSYTFQGEPRVAQEWLSQVLLYLPFRAFGYTGDVILFACIVTLAFFLIFRLCLKLGINDLVAILLVFWGALLARPFFTVRPLMFTWLFFAIFLTSLYLYHRGISRWLWHLPLLMVLWVNLHGGFAIGLALIGLMLLARIGERVFMRKPLDLRHLLIVLGLSMLATFVNPNGFAGISHPLVYLGFDNVSARFISEWQSPNFHDYYWLSLLASFMLLMALGVVRRQMGGWPVLLTAVLATMALQSVRHIPLYALAMAPILGETLLARLDVKSRLETERKLPKLRRLNWLILILLMGGFVAAGVASPLSQLKKMPLQSRGVTYPEAGAKYVRTNYPEARMFNDYDWGGYLIYALFPTQKVFIDGRMDLYSSQVLSDYGHVVFLRPDWEEVLDRYKVDLVLIHKGSPLSVLLTSAPSWQRVFTGEVEDIFVRRPTGNSVELLKYTTTHGSGE